METYLIYFHEKAHANIFTKEFLKETHLKTMKIYES